MTYLGRFISAFLRDNLAFRDEYRHLDSRLENISSVLEASNDETDQKAAHYLVKYRAHDQTKTNSL